MGNPNPTPFKKTGADANPNGRPKGVPNTKTRLARLLKLTNNLTNPLTGSKKLEGFSIAEQMDLAQILKAIEGDTGSYKAVLDRLEGMPTQNVQSDITIEVKPILGGLSVPGNNSNPKAIEAK